MIARMSDNTVRTATSLGAGLILDEDHEINVVLMVGNDGVMDTAAPMSVLVAEELVRSLQGMIEEAKLVQEAVLTMPLESARQYMENWAARHRR